MFGLFRRNPATKRSPTRQMVNRSRLSLQRLEERDTPASFSALLSGGAVVSGSFSTPAGVDPAEASQVVELTDLNVVRGGVTYTPAPVPLAYYSYGALTGVVANLYTPDDQIDLSWNGTAVLTPVSGPTETGTIAYDVADAQVTFTLPDGTVGTISYQIPWSQVDPNQSNQSLALTAFNLNIAGQNFAYGTANYTSAPTLNFVNGALAGVAFAVNLANTGSPYSSVSVSNGVATAVAAATGAVLNAPVADTQATPFAFISLAPLGTQANAYVLNIKFTAADGRTFTQAYNIGANSTAAQVTDAVFQSIPKASTTVAFPNPTYNSGWYVKINDAKTGFYVYGFRPTTVTAPNAPPDFSIVSVTATAVGLPAASQPSIIEPVKK